MDIEGVFICYNSSIVMKFIVAFFVGLFVFAGYYIWRHGGIGSIVILPGNEVRAYSEDILTAHSKTPLRPVNLNIKQGIYGHITFGRGECNLNSAGGLSADEEAACRQKLQFRLIYIRKPAGTNNVDAGFLLVKTDQVALAKTDADGFYQVELEPGNYSVFVKEIGQEYCDSKTVLDGETYYCLVKVAKGKVTKYNPVVSN